MSNKTRKRFLPVGLAMAVVAIGVMALVIALAGSPQDAQAHGSSGGAADCDNAITRIIHDNLYPNDPCPSLNTAPSADSAALEPVNAIMVGATATFTSTITDADDGDTLSWDWSSGDTAIATVMGNGNMATVTGVAAGTTSIMVTATDMAGETFTQTGSITVNAPPAGPPATLTSSSNGAGSSLKLTLEIANPGALLAGSSVVLFLEDDFQVGDIDMSKVYFVGKGTGRVYVTDSIVVSDDDHFGGDDDHDIQVFVPDMNPGNDTGFDAWEAADAMGLQLVLDKAGVKNPTEAGTHSVGYSVLTASQSEAGPDYSTNAGMQDGDKKVELEAHTDTDTAKVGLKTQAKIELSDEDTGRGKEITVTGTGFNNGTGAEVYVLIADAKPASCRELVANDAKVSLGTAAVGSDDKFVVTFTVHQDDFDPGAVNYICAVDSEAGNPRFSSDVDTFTLEASVSVDPASANFGDEITIKARDFGGALDEIALGPKHVWKATEQDKCGTGSGDMYAPGDKRADGSTIFCVKEIDGNDYMIDVPGDLDEQIQIAVKRGSTRKTTTMSIVPSSLKLSMSEVAPNASVIISGSGFTENARIYTDKITIDGEALDVSDAGTQADGSRRYVQVTSNGEFTATVRVWTADADATNPALDNDEYTIKVVDDNNFEGETKITILEPTVSVSPDTASPRDFIVISGENWPISTADDDNEVNINVDNRNRSANIDGNGRFRYEYQLRSTIGIGDEHDVIVTFAYGGKADAIEEEATFNVTEAALGLDPGMAAPGETISVSVEGMPPYQLVDHVKIDGADRLGGRNINTDREGDATVSDILVPYLDPGFYPVEVKVGNETRVAQLEVLAEAAVPGVASMLPEAVSGLGDNLDAIFHFNNTSKEWSFFDPRPEFADLNTLTELNGGQPYWVLVKDSQDDVDWNGRLVNFTCAADDCWNLEIW